MMATVSDLPSNDIRVRTYIDLSYLREKELTLTADPWKIVPTGNVN